MCMVSNTGDYFQKNLPEQYPWLTYAPIPEVSRHEFNELKKKVEDMIELLKAAQKYDKKHGEPDCQIDDKMEFLKKIAALVGIDLYKEMKFKNKKKTTKRKLLNESKKA